MSDQVDLDLLRLLLIAQAHPLADALDVGVDDHAGRDLEGVVQHQRIAGAEDRC